MIIIYRGSRPLLPLAACHFHFNKETLLTAPPATWWEREYPLSVIGVDSNENLICGLVTGRHGNVFDRALRGITEIFGIPLSIIDIDQLVSRYIRPWSLAHIKLVAVHYLPWYREVLFSRELQLIFRNSLSME